MGKKSLERESLGLTQFELAALLNISRPVLALYETGKRSLPVSAHQKMSELLAHAQSAKTDVKAESGKDERALLVKHIERLVLENDYQRMTVSRKIADTEQKKAKAMRREQLSGFVEQHDFKGERNPLPFSKLSGKNSVAAYGTTLMKLELRQELLGLEQTFLAAKLAELLV
ncbi:MAG: XRE family transcriptional regulator [Flavobacterium sp.]|uniref:helix-turn-helix domain-containing protein n=1 Tax=Flavobacterium sp. TaxID=239 RepID=UPI0012295A40|nr:helix-turn-helix transcriptional regulator [Flavobacterium sp.]RZJ67479.1 MAG: XRE family transcriptional regulator [Flavobacterium sp.]